MALIKCSECGKEISDTAKECIHCGCPIEKKQVCSECGNEVDSTVKVCPNCGNTLQQAPMKLKIPKKVNPRLIQIGVIVVGIIVVVITIFSFKGSTSKKINLSEIFKLAGCDTYYCELANDGSYIEVDTNPLDLDDYSSTSAFNMVKALNKELGFNESLNSKMLKTRALDGTLSDENDNIKVTWTYHPDRGLNVTYELK